MISRVFMVDDTRLELVTSRTSSGCATSCANRPSLSARGILQYMPLIVKNFFHFLVEKQGPFSRALFFLAYSPQ